MASPHNPPQQIHAYFAQIAKRYDFFNRAFSLGIADYWRSVLRKHVLRTKPQRILDLATGSGDVAKLFPNQTVVAVDFCRPMLLEARSKNIAHLIEADARHLPFANDSFDAVTIAFGLRNFTDRARCLSEIFRVLRHGGSLWILEFYRPTLWIRGIYFFYLYQIMPKIASWILGDGSAYFYLGKSIEQFPDCQNISDELRCAGFCEIKYWKMTLGIVAIHGAWKTAGTPV